MASSRGILLDTNTFLWAGAESAKLSKAAAKELSNPEVKLFVSIASVWEMQIKHALGKLPLIENADRVAVRYAAALKAEFLPIELDHLSVLYSLPAAHRDPFDRILAAQSIAESLTLCSPDPVFRAYSLNAIW